MTRLAGQPMDTDGTEPTRREALRLGGATLAALLAAGLGGRAVTAQEASPEATPTADGGMTGRYVVVRMRQPNPDWSVDEMMRLIGEGYVPLVQSVPGFFSYFGTADPTTGDQVYVGVFADKAGADESTRLAGEWLTANSYDFFTGDPVVVEGVIAVAAEAGR